MIHLALKRKGVTSIVVVLPATKDMCMIKKPITLKANAKFKTVVHDTRQGQMKPNTIQALRKV